MKLQDRLKKLEQKNKSAEPETWIMYLSSPPRWEDIPDEEKVCIQERVAKTIAEGYAKKSEVICCGVPNGYPGIED